jgi:hypothetical protein
MSNVLRLDKKTLRLSHDLEMNFMEQDKLLQMVELAIDIEAKEAEASLDREIIALERSFSSRGILISSFFFNQITEIYIEYINKNSEIVLRIAFEYLTLYGDVAEPWVCDYVKSLLNKYTAGNSIIQSKISKHIERIYRNKSGKAEKMLSDKIIDAKETAYKKLELKLFSSLNSNGVIKSTSTYITINGNSGIVQTGHHPSATMTTNSTVSSGEIKAIIEKIDSLISMLEKEKEKSSIITKDLINDVSIAKEEFNKKQPNYERALSLISTAGTVISAVPAIKPSYEILKICLQKVGIPLP